MLFGRVEIQQKCEVYQLWWEATCRPIPTRSGGCFHGAKSSVRQSTEEGVEGESVKDGAVEETFILYISSKVMSVMNIIVSLHTTIGGRR